LVADGVGEQVGDGLVDAVGVGPYRYRGSQVGVDPHARRIQLWSLGGEGRAGDVGEAGVDRVQRQRGGFGGGQVGQVGHHAAEP